MLHITSDFRTFQFNKNDVVLFNTYYVVHLVGCEDDIKNVWRSGDDDAEWSLQLSSGCSYVTWLMVFTTSLHIFLDLSSGNI